MNTLASEYYGDDRHHDGYDYFRALIADRVANAVGPLFTTAEATGIPNYFLQELPREAQQHYTCHACASFLVRFGGLVTVDPSGDTVPLLWRQWEQTPFFAGASEALYHRVKKALITGVFVSSAHTWGTPETPPWTHLYGRPPEALVHTSVLRTASEQAADYREDFQTLLHAREQYTLSVIHEALRVFQSLPWGPTFAPQLEWLKQVKMASTTRLWQAVATAPAGWCHVKSSMVGSLLEDIANGLNYDDIRARFAAKMHPLQYRRPTTVTRGNIDQAERIVAKAGIQESLKRRFATMADVHPFWGPLREVARGGVFSHLKLTDRKRAAYTILSKTVTWVKFATQVLPGAAQMEVHIPEARLPLSALVTAVEPTAPTILQWSPPVSWYVYHQGSYARHWNLKLGWVQVKALAYNPVTWKYAGIGQPYHIADFVLWVLEGCYDKQYIAGGSFFPSMLKAEYHSIRSTLEAYAKSAVLDGDASQAACGLLLQSNVTWNLRVRVNGQDEYLIDRWD